MGAPFPIELKVPPGVVKSRSGEGAAGRWNDARNIRFVNGKPEKKAGFAARNTTPVRGIPRAMEVWQTLANEEAVLVGTTRGLFGQVAEDEFTDFSPRVHQIELEGKLTTTSGAASVVLDGTDVDLFSSETISASMDGFFSLGSRLITFQLASHGFVAGGWIEMHAPPITGAPTLAGVYPITDVPTSNSFTILHTGEATSTDTETYAVTYSLPKFAPGATAILNRADLPPSSHGLLINREWVVAKPDVATGYLDKAVLFPATPSGTLTNPFTPDGLGSYLITVAHSSHGKETGDRVCFISSAAFSEIFVSGEYAITKINDNSYKITSNRYPLFSLTTGGGTVTYRWADGTAEATQTDLGVVSVEPKSDHNEDYPVDGMVESISTTDLSDQVVLNFCNDVVPANVVAGSIVTISEAVAVNGITLDGAYVIDSVDTGAGTATITHSATATATSTVQPEAYFLFSGVVLADDVSGATEAGYWSLDNSGEDAVASYLNGPAYYFDTSTEMPATIIPNAPTDCRFVFVTDERMLHCLGIDGDPLKFGWSDQDDFSNWTASQTTTANPSRRVTQGAKLVAGTKIGKGLNALWTDTQFYLHQYTGSAFIYDTEADQVSGTGLIGPHAFCRTPAGLMWIGQNQFWMWNGYSQPIPNAKDVESWFFDQLDVEQSAKSWAMYDPANKSVDFFGVRSGQSEPDLVVTVCLDDFSWCNDQFGRTAGAVASSGQQKPLMMSESGILYEHETGLNANGSAAAFTLNLAPFEAAKGRYVEITGYDNDAKRQTGDVTLTVSTYDRYPGTVVDTETATITATGEMTDLRSAGRHIGLQWSQELIDGDFALDTPDIELRGIGTRR